MTAGRIGMALAAAGALLAIALTVRWTPPGDGVPEQVDLEATFPDVDGREVRLADFAGKPMVINLWATWCGPCRLETPQLVDLHAKYRERGLVILGISIDDRPEAIRAFADEFKVTYPMLVGRDRHEELAALGYSGPVPMTVFVRPDGTIATRVVGIATTASMERRILALFE